MILRIFRALLGVKARPFMSSKYWESRYAAGGNSGEGHMEDWRNSRQISQCFIQFRDVNTSIELGCGDGNQLTMLKYPNYLGLDVSPTAVRSVKGNSRRTRTFVS